MAADDEGGPQARAHVPRRPLLRQHLPLGAAQRRGSAGLLRGQPRPVEAVIEVMEAAKALGASPYPNSQRIYRHLAPYCDSLAGLVGASFPDTVLTKEELVEAGLVKPNELDMGLVPESQQTKVAQDSAASLERMNGASANDAA